MAVLPEYPWKDEKGNLHADLIKHYSDEGLKIQKVGTNEIYDSAVDRYPTAYSYVETNIPINQDVNRPTGEEEAE